MKIDAILLTYCREKTLSQAVDGLKRQSCIRDIYVVYNYLSTIKIPGVINIYSEKNYKCRLRHSLALNLDTDYILFVDDDFEIPSDYSKYIINGIKKYGNNAVLGSDGIRVDVNKTKETRNYYLPDSGFSHTKEPVFVDIVKGRFHIVKKQYIAYTFLYENKLYPFKRKKELRHDNVSIHDDVFINLSIQSAINKPSVVIPIPKFNEFNLVGLWKRKEHFKERSNFIKRFIDYGWFSLVNN